MQLNQMTKQDEVVYSVYSMWIDGVSRITRVWRNALESSPKWKDTGVPPPVDICDAIRIALDTAKERFNAEPSELVRTRVTLQSTDPDMWFWFVTIEYSGSSFCYSLEIGVLMDGNVVIPEENNTEKSPLR